jgi:peptide/nickel transport system ATP-binding protein
VMYAGQECESGPVSEIIDTPKHPYTIGLIECIPDLAAPDRRLTPIPGAPPDPTDLPPGCLFHPRCPQVMPVCRVETPVDKAIGPQHRVKCHLYDAL